MARGVEGLQAAKQAADDRSELVDDAATKARCAFYFDGLNSSRGTGMRAVVSGSRKVSDVGFVGNSIKRGEEGDRKKG